MKGRHWVAGQQVYCMDIELMAVGRSIGGLIVAFVLCKKNDSIEIEDKKVAEITQEIQGGAMAFLWAEVQRFSQYSS